jgi:hypothetical protein
MVQLPLPPDGADFKKIALYFRAYNSTSIEQHRSRSITCGVSQEESSTFNINTGIEVSASAGVGVEGIAEVSATASVSMELGYSRTSTYTQFMKQQTIMR